MGGGGCVANPPPRFFCAGSGSLFGLEYFRYSFCENFRGEVAEAESPLFILLRGLSRTDENRPHLPEVKFRKVPLRGITWRTCDIRLNGAHRLRYDINARPNGIFYSINLLSVNY